MGKRTFPAGCFAGVFLMALTLGMSGMSFGALKLGAPFADGKWRAKLASMAASKEGCVLEACLPLGAFSVDVSEPVKTAER